MKKKLVGVVLCMAVWTAGSYALGRHHGATRGEMKLPYVVRIEKVQPPEAVKETKAAEVSTSKSDDFD